VIERNKWLERLVAKGGQRQHWRVFFENEALGRIDASRASVENDPGRMWRGALHQVRAFSSRSIRPHLQETEMIGISTLSRLTPRALALPLAVAAVAWLGGNAHAQWTPFESSIDSTQETPPTGAPGTGFGFLALDQSINSVSFKIDITSFTSAEQLAHIHKGAVGIAGPIIVSLPLGTNISGSVAFPAAQVPALLAGGDYTNFHTANFGAGELRGQVIIPAVVGTSSCDANTATPCPCGNPPAGPGQGCDNSSATGGAILTARGNPSLGTDRLVFTTTGEKPTATTILLQGLTIAPPVPFGQGLRCVNGNLKRLYTKSAANGSIIAPAPIDIRVSARSAALGDPIPANASRSYMAYYRDPTVLGGCSSASTFNGTQAVTVTWTP
jgi:hypothetical protein